MKWKRGNWRATTIGMDDGMYKTEYGIDEGGVENITKLLGKMKITVPEGDKAQIVNAVCKFIGFKTEGVLETGAVFLVGSSFIRLGVFV